MSGWIVVAIQDGILTNTYTARLRATDGQVPCDGERFRLWKGRWQGASKDERARIPEPSGRCPNPARWGYRECPEQLFPWSLCEACLPDEADGGWSP